MHDPQTTTLTLSANGATAPVPMLKLVLSGMLSPDVLVGFRGGATLSWAVELTQDARPGRNMLDPGLDHRAVDGWDCPVFVDG